MRLPRIHAVSLLLLITVAYLISLVYSDLSFYDSDTAYLVAFENVKLGLGFSSFTATQGYPCLPLYLLYLIGAPLFHHYDSVHFVIIFLYSLSLLLIILQIIRKPLFTSSQNLAYTILVSLFLIAGHYSLVLVDSAEKMLVAFTAYFFAIYSRNTHRQLLSASLYLVASLSHASIIVLLVLSEFQFLHSMLKYTLSQIISNVQKVNKRLLLALLFTLPFALKSGEILSKFMGIIERESTTNSSLIVLYSLIASFLFVRGSIKLYPILFGLFFILLNIPLGRIAWFFMLYVILLPRFGCFMYSRRNLYLLFLLPACLLFVVKSYMSIQSGMLF